MALRPGAPSGALACRARALATGLLAAACLAGCAGGLRIVDRPGSVAQDSRVQFIVLHYTEGDFDEAYSTLTQGDVSSHYLVDREPPTIYRLVPEGRRAWHAGLSSWQGHTALNAASIGIEIVNRGYLVDKSGPYAPYPAAQIDRVIALVRDIARRHAVRPDRIIGHSDIAPTRKVDPGPMFPWARLAGEGLIPWPDADQVAARRARFAAGEPVPEVAWFQVRLARHGFLVPRHGQLDGPTRDALVAFQMKYRPARYDGEPDAESAALLDVVTTAGGLLIVGPDGQRRPYAP